MVSGMGMNDQQRGLMKITLEDVFEKELELVKSVTTLDKEYVQ